MPLGLGYELVDISTIQDFSLYLVEDVHALPLATCSLRVDVYALLEDILPPLVDISPPQEAFSCC